jgi:hypothetical protein
MAERDDALLAIHAAGVFPLEHGIVEDAGRAHEIDAVLAQIPAAEFVVPLEHDSPLRPLPHPGLIGAQRDLASTRRNSKPMGEGLLAAYI